MKNVRLINLFSAKKSQVNHTRKWQYLHNNSRIGKRSYTALAAFRKNEKSKYTMSNKRVAKLSKPKSTLHRQS